MASGLKIIVDADITKAEAALKKVSTEAQTAGRQIDRTFSATSLPLTKAIDDSSRSIQKATANIEEENISLKEQRAILAQLKKDFAQLTPAQVQSPLGKEFQKDIAIAKAEVSRLSAVSVNSLGAVGKAGTKAFSALRAAALILPGIGIAGIIGIASDAIASFADSLFGASEEAKKAKENLEKFKETVKGIFEETGKEAAQAGVLVAVLKSETETRERKLSAIKELQKLQPEIFSGLKLEGNTVIGLDQAYKNYIKNLQTVIAVKIKQAQLEQLITKQLQRQGVALTQSEKDFLNNLKATTKGAVTETGFREKAEQKIVDLKELEAKHAKEDLALEKDIAAIIADISELSKGVKLPDLNAAGNDKELQKILSRAKALAKFFSDTTIFELKFEVDPEDSLSESVKKATDFINRTLANSRTFGRLRFGTEVFIDENFFARSKKKIESDEKNRLKLFADISPDSPEQKANIIKSTQQLGKFIEELTKRNPILLQVEFDRKRAQQKGAAINSFLGVANSKLDDVDEQGKPLFDESEKQSLLFAKTLNDVLTPAIDNVFNAIKAGENPLKAFFEGLGQSVLQLISKLIQAAATAAILAALLPGGIGGAKGFGEIFGKLLGFAGGGQVEGGKPIIVGERGAELWVPPASGNIIPNHALFSQSGSAQVIVMATQVRGNNLALVQNRNARRNQRLGVAG